MRVILLQDIKSLGQRGDIKNVADGYARNFLLPRNLVKPATPSAMKESEFQEARVKEIVGRLQLEVGKIEKETAGEPLVFEVRVGKRGEIFGAIGASEIKAKLIK